MRMAKELMDSYSSSMPSLITLGELEVGWDTMEYKTPLVLNLILLTTEKLVEITLELISTEISTLFKVHTTPKE